MSPYLNLLHLELQIETQLGLMKELIRFLQMDSFIVLMKANLWVCCLVKHLDYTTGLYWDLQMVLQTQLKMARFRDT